MSIDDLREQSGAPLFEDEGDDYFEEYDDLDDLKSLDDFGDFTDEDDEFEGEDRRRSRRRGGGQFMGMTPAQRFVLAFLLLLTTCVMGSFCLIITGTISP